MRPPNEPPNNIDTLMTNAKKISGLSLLELAHFAQVQIPMDFKRHKGWTGQLIELWLGASAGSKPIQDFPELGIELKTIPIDRNGMPLETTYVCFAHLMPIMGETWLTSNVRNKLQHVLWVPVEGERHIPIAQRRVGSSFLWQPDAQQNHQLEQDWTEITELIVSGQIEQITSRFGEVMQLRPKAANGRSMTDAIGENGETIKTRPRGFYLKKNFTRVILSKAFSV